VPRVDDAKRVTFNWAGITFRLFGVKTHHAG
jgi:hypothetical protein